MNDEQIVDLFFKKEEEAIKETKAKYGKKLFFISKNILNNEFEAEECENDTYLLAWNSIPPNSPKQYFFSYLAKIIRNLSFNVYKRNHNKSHNAIISELSIEMQECIPSNDNIERKVATNELEDLLNLFLHRLNVKDCRIFILRYWFCESIVSISKKLVINEGTIKSTLHRTRNKLKLYLESEGYNI